jgi:Protein of unknown function (DUF4079)
MGNELSDLLEPIAGQFRSLGIPAPITHWGHPLMMGIVMFAMGGFAVYAGWQGRISNDEQVKLEAKSNHRKLMPWVFIFMATGYTGGLLSLVMQEKPILESPHFWTGSIVLILLAINGAISFGNFAGDKSNFRTIHAYLGSVAFATMILHAILGLNLGFSI